MGSAPGIGDATRQIVVTDSGPIIHLCEIDAHWAWNIFPEVIVPYVVGLEVARGRSGHPVTSDHQRFTKEEPNPGLWTMAGHMSSGHGLSPNDAYVLATGIELHAGILLTDDLELRAAVRAEGIIPVGTIGILLRSFRDRHWSLDDLFGKLDLLLHGSSLYITPKLIDEVKMAAKGYS